MWSEAHDIANLCHMAQTIRPAFSDWPKVNEALAELVSKLTPEQLLTQPSPERWPVWATIGHLACQRVFWLCDFAGEPDKETTRFTNAAYDCPGDDDLTNVLGPAELAEALDSTFRIVDRCLDTWTVDGLDEVIRRPTWGEDWVHTRGSVIQRVHTHDAWHAGQVSLTLGMAGLPRLDVWS